jgi:hypothetical protein
MPMLKRSEKPNARAICQGSMLSKLLMKLFLKMSENDNA